MLPAAPPRFSTSTGWPHFSPSFCAITRPRMSVVPPAAQGTIMRTGLFGKACAAACGAKNGRRTRRVASRRRRISKTILAEERALDAVFRLFGERGFDVPLHPALVRRAGGRKGLRERVLARLFAGRWQSRWD